MRPPRLLPFSASISSLRFFVRLPWMRPDAPRSLCLRSGEGSQNEGSTPPGEGLHVPLRTSGCERPVLPRLRVQAQFGFDRERVPFPELLSVKDEGSLLSRQLWAGSECRRNHLLPPRAHCAPLRLTVQLDFLGGAISVLKLLFLSFYLLVKKKLLSALAKSLRKTFRDCGFQ